MSVLVDSIPYEPQTDRPMTPRHLTVSERVEDSWHRMGASTELLTNMQEADLRGIESQGSSAFEKTVRVGALRCLSQMLQGITGSQAYWFKAALLLDHYSSTCADVQKLPLTCGAIARIVAKADFSMPNSVPLLSERCPGRRLTKDFAGWVDATFSCKTSDITDRALCKQEQAIMKALDWEVDYPCVDQWCYVYFARFRELAGFQSPDQLQQMQTRVSISARAILMSRPSTHGLSHGDLALGLFCLSFVDAAHLPLMSLKPDYIDDTEWSILYGASQPGGEAREPPDDVTCRTCPSVASEILQMLCLTVQEDKKEVCEKVHNVVRELIEAFRWIQNFQSANRGG